ncbi:hypothetical protein [Rhodanobacter soli]
MQTLFQAREQFHAREAVQAQVAVQSRVDPYDRRVRFLRAQFMQQPGDLFGHDMAL